jgi:GH18 family chitinase
MLVIFRLLLRFAATVWISCSWANGQALAVELIGYVPNYRMENRKFAGDVLLEQLKLLDEVRYFGITVLPSAELSTTDADLGRLRSIKSLIDRLPTAERPRLGVTIGGSGKSEGFSAVAASEELCDKFSKNLHALLDQTGATAVDLDWEHPAAGAECDTLYPAMLTRIKEELGAERRVYATLEPSTFISAKVLSGPHAIDGVSLMTYDLNWWNNVEGNPEKVPHSSHEHVEDSVQAWSDAPGAPNQRPSAFAAWGQNAPAGKLGVGLPLYGRGFNGSNPKSSVGYRDLIAHGATADGAAYRYRSADYWIPSLDDVRLRVKYAEAKRLQHIILWELTQDLPPRDERSMLRAANAARSTNAVEELDERPPPSSRPSSQAAAPDNGAGDHAER